MKTIPDKHSPSRSVESAHSQDAQRITIRTHRPGDIGWSISRHGELYFKDYGWNSEFEALVAEVYAKFLRNQQTPHGRKLERCWIAEMNGERVGTVTVVDAEEDHAINGRVTRGEVAKLRMLIVEPEARGQRLGSRLIQEAITFATSCGYKRMTLWTQSNLIHARALYERAGFQMTHSAPHHAFGYDLIEEVWEREL